MDIRDKTPRIQLAMVELMRQAGLPDATARLIAELIAENARFDLWVALVKKKQATENEMLSLLDRDEDLERRCRAAVREFKVDDDETSLRHVLSDLIDELAKMRMS
jgi:hypothetical protein